MVKSAIEQVRFRISGSYAVARSVQPSCIANSRVLPCLVQIGNHNLLLLCSLKKKQKVNPYANNPSIALCSVIGFCVSCCLSICLYCGLCCLSVSVLWSLSVSLFSSFSLPSLLWSPSSSSLSVQQEQAKRGLALSKTCAHTPKSKKNKVEKNTSPEAQDAFMPTTGSVLFYYYLFKCCQTIKICNCDE